MSDKLEYFVCMEVCTKPCSECHEVKPYALARVVQTVSDYVKYKVDRDLKGVKRV